MSFVAVAILFTAALLAQTRDLLGDADAAFRAADLAAAAKLAQRALAADPNAAHAHMILGVIAAQRNDWAVSTSHFQKVIRLQPSDPHGYFYLGQAKLYQQQWEQAIRYFSQALERNYPARERLLVELALARNEAGHPRQALATLAMTPPPADRRLGAQYHAVAAFACAKLNNLVRAIESMRQAVALDDSNPQNWEFLITALIRSDEAPRALSEAIRAQRKFPDQPDILYAFALASYYVNESPLSRLALRNLRDAELESPRVALAEGLLYRKQGKNEEAIAAFRRASDRGAPDAPLLLGILYKEAGDDAAAERELLRAERLNPRNGQAMLELGKLLLARGDLEQARLRLERAAESMPGVTTVHYQLGLLYRRLGQPEKAQRHFALSKRP
jgi:tetratricopeptide (TPR) repeat protein